MAQHHVTSLSLLERLRGREQGSWERLLALYRPLVYHWCQAGGVRGAEADDVVQEVFLAASQGMAQFERQREGSFRRWLRGITRHKLLDSYRRRRRHPEAAGGTEAQLRVQELPDPEAESADDAAEVGGLWRRALEQVQGEFEPRTWQAFWRSAVEGHPTDLIAAELNMSMVAVRIAKSRVLGRLRAEVGDLID